MYQTTADDLFPAKESGIICNKIDSRRLLTGRGYKAEKLPGREEVHSWTIQSGSGWKSFMSRRPEMFINFCIIYAEAESFQRT